VDTAPAQPTGTAEHASRAAEEVRAAGLLDAAPGGALIGELWRTAEAELVGLSETEFGEALQAVEAKCNFSLDAEQEATATQREAFWRGLHVADLALARGCALGREAAWRRFVARFREPLMRAAVGITKSAALGEELATALYSELFGLTEREGVRWSPLATYSGRGSLMGWLRAMLAQRHVNHIRKTHRETTLEDDAEMTAPVETPTPNQQNLRVLEAALQLTLAGLVAEERLLLSAYYLDRHTLLEIARVLNVHEATVSRKLKRITEHLRKQLLRALQAHGFSRRAAEEALGTDPRYLDMNLRKLLQTPGTSAFSNTKGQS
jgi:RNA polymerase sigma-70 factor (ECF subfamily)